jgi:hypothetical protein
MSIHMTLHEDGSVTFADASGEPLPDDLRRLAVRQNGEEVGRWLDEQAEKVNREVDELLNLHLATPAPGSIPAYEPKPFDQPMPALPELRKLRWWLRLFPGLYRRYQAENDNKIRWHDEQRSAWRDAKARHTGRESRLAQEAAERLRTDAAFMESLLEARLAAIPWTRETQASLTVSEDGRQVFVDVDLPEIEDMPGERARPAAKGDRLIKKALSQRDLRLTYMTHVHGIAFRILGEVFGVLPTAEEVVVSGYSRRPDPATGRLRDDYLYSVRVSRGDWARIDFAHLERLDVVEAIAGFDLRRSVTKTGIFKPVAPFASTVGEAAVQ